MDIFLTQDHTYIVTKPVETVRFDISKIIDKKWHDFSNNITGVLNTDDSFKLTHKWALGYISGGGSFIYLNGIIRQENTQTIIDITVRPNIVLVLFSYFISVLLVCEVIGIKTMLEGPRIALILTLLLFCSILFGLIYYLGKGLRNRFERHLGLTR
jgi:hypothetical protein